MLGLMDRRAPFIVSPRFPPTVCKLPKAKPGAPPGFFFGCAHAVGLPRGSVIVRDGSVNQRNDRSLHAVANEALKGLQIGAGARGMRLDADQARRSVAARTSQPVGEVDRCDVES